MQSITTIIITIDPLHLADAHAMRYLIACLNYKLITLVSGDTRYMYVDIIFYGDPPSAKS